ncbi:MAG: DUF4843 domain-containing protein [Bacteroidales bacterium]|nr:DUF4843 domain-containing protein [Bacteroidales bacterium]
MQYLCCRFRHLKQTIDMNRYTIILLAAFLALVSCVERTPGHFQDISGVYFNNMTGTMQVTDSLDVTFVYTAGDDLDVPVRVQLLGRTSSDDRAFAITVSSENAEEGIDYVLPADAVIPTGASYADYIVTLKRTEALKSEKKMIFLQIHSNENFGLPVTNVIQYKDTVSTLEYRIYFSDMFTKAPAAWDANLVGVFTQQKFELICKVLDIDPADFNDPSVITLAKLLYISAEMSSYVEEQVEKKDAGLPYDENAFDKETGEPLNFRK